MRNKILDEMFSKGYEISEFDYNDPYYLEYEKYFKTGIFKSIIVSAAFTFLNKRECINFDTCIPEPWILITEEDRHNPYHRWPEWTSDFGSLTKLTIVFGIEKAGTVRCLHAVVYNAVNPPHNAQLDFLAYDIDRWNIEGGNVDQLLTYYKYSCGRTTLNFGDSLINYCEKIIHQDFDFFVFLNNLLMATSLLCHSLLYDADLVFAHTTQKIVQSMFDAISHLRNNN